MKDYQLFFAIIFSSIVIFLISSCTKSSSSSTGTMLIGTWKDIQAASDNNHNGVMDASEIQALSASESDIITFKSDGSGIVLSPNVSGGIDTIKITYRVSSNHLVIFSGGDSAMSIIDSISSTRLILKDTSSVPFWDIFQKQ